MEQTWVMKLKSKAPLLDPYYPPGHGSAPWRLEKFFTNMLLKHSDQITKHHRNKKEKM